MGGVNTRLASESVLFPGPHYAEPVAPQLERDVQLASLLQKGSREAGANLEESS